MRDIDDILADVIEALEPEESLPRSPGRWDVSPLGLWMVVRGQWVRTLGNVQLLSAVAKTHGVVVTLIIAEQSCRVDVMGLGPDGQPFRVGQSGADPIEAVILALAKALGVEMEE